MASTEIAKESASKQESRQDIDRSATSQGLMVRNAKELKQDYQGVVVAVTNHHVLLRISEMVAIRYEKSNLDQPVASGDKVAIQHGNEKSQVYETGKEPARESSKDMERSLR